MKMRTALLAAFVVALVLIVLLVSLREYYVAIALTVGAVILTRRELWYMMKKRKLPPFDERVRENMKKSARNGFIFFAAASAALMLFYTIDLVYVANHHPARIMSGLFLAGGLVYLLSYVFYDRVEPKLGEKEVRRLKAFLQVAGIAAGACIASFILHNVISGLLGIEEPVFFVIAVILSPGAIAVGLIGSLVIFARGLVRKQLPSERVSQGDVVQE
jgi:hypothetical protein